MMGVPELNSEQSSALEVILNTNRSIFITGEAGTGKSVLLRHVAQQLEAQYTSGQVVLTASTGLAALAIGGSTLHGFTGIGLAKEEVSELVPKIIANEQAMVRWNTVKVLVVDEASLLNGHLLDTLDYIATQIREKENFGGIRLILVGDFLQLPPVGSDAIFLFESNWWKTYAPLVINLKQRCRQQEGVFTTILQAIRYGSLTSDLVTFLQENCSLKEGEVPDMFPQLYPTRDEVQAANYKKLEKIDAEFYRFDCLDFVCTNGDKYLLDYNCPAAKSLFLKLGCRVMLLTRISANLVNGSMGTITGFELQKGSDDAVLERPIVQFDSVNGMEPDTRVIGYRKWLIPSFKFGHNASRTQLPLAAGYAYTVHKAQGKTMATIYSDFERSFTYGQVYVALSRVKSLEGLRVANLTVSSIKAHPKALGFYESLDVQEAMDLILKDPLSDELSFASDEY